MENFDFKRYYYNTRIIFSSEYGIVVQVELNDSQTNKEISAIEGGSYKDAALLEQKALETAFQRISLK